ncbi:GntR family transcriptional regulator [Acidicapsa acidisoli]|uniref:GntR family transcriptional regulator n=1 Tax=Acidicapsa acidisoli TaxID=1615681 RepID=UPI0021DF60FE|nr:GntR family transcriptional regulator [Acidicapsa acidisoli]
MAKHGKTIPAADAAAISTVISEASHPESSKKIPKHQVVFDYLHGSIQSGVLKPGDRLPSEAELGKMFDASRITVAKAVLELQRMNLVTRRPGAGTHVQTRQQVDGHTFGLLIPELGLTEIFEPICHGMMRSPFARPDALVWGNASGAGASGSRREVAEEAEHMAQHFIARKVSGIFFAPLELIPDKDAANRRIVRMLERMKIPIVLLDRCYLPYPERSSLDLVGIDNRRTGFLATEHLIQLGVRELAFLAEDHSASTVDARITGFHEALRRHGIRPEVEPAWRGSAQDQEFVKKALEITQAKGIVCANDVTAARLMQTLLAMGRRIPEDVRIVGIDDVKYASLLPVPLTTMHQNCPAIGVIAMATMLERLEHPDLPTRDILVPTKLVVRRSCGAHLDTNPSTNPDR